MKILKRQHQVDEKTDSAQVQRHARTIRPRSVVAVQSAGVKNIMAKRAARYQASA